MLKQNKKISKRYRIFSTQSSVDVAIIDTTDNTIVEFCHRVEYKLNPYNSVHMLHVVNEMNRENRHYLGNLKSYLK